MSSPAPFADGRPLRVALVAPVGQSVPPARSGSVEAVSALLADGLAARGHDVTLFATAGSRTGARLHATFARGYQQDEALWPWELCELFNLGAAIERADRFDVVHYQAEYAPLALPFSRVCSAPIVQTLHHAPSSPEVRLWTHYPDAPFVAISETQARALRPLNVVAVIHHAVDPATYVFRADPDDYLLFLGRFTEGKGVLSAIEAARQVGLRLVLAAAENQYFRERIARHVDGRQIVYVGEVGTADKVRLLGGALALLYPLQVAEPFGLVLIEAIMCGTPVAALTRGAVTEIVEPGVTGEIFDSVDALAGGLSRVLALDRTTVRSRAVERFGPTRLIDAHVEVYTRLATGHGRPGRVRC